MNKYFASLFIALLSLSLLDAQAQIGVQKVKEVKKSDGTVVKRFKVRRDKSVHPTYAAFFAYVKQGIDTGTLTYTLANGTVVTPTVSTTSTVPSWVPTTRYSYASAKLTVEAYAISSGETPYLSFAAVSGATLTGLSGGGANLVSGTFYHPGPQTTQGLYVWEWTFQSGNGTAGIPAGVPIRITYRKGTSTETYARDFTPTVGTNINLLTAGNTSPPTNTTTTTSPPASTTGAAPYGITFNFELPAPGSQEIWTSSNNTVIANGIAPGQIARLDNSSYGVEIRKGFGGAIQIFDKSQTDFRGGPKRLFNFLDQGRESGMSSYGGPDNFAAGQDQSGIGFNPLQAGDSGGNSSIYITSGITPSGWAYTKFKCLSWPHKTALQVDFYYEQWVKLTGNRVDVHVRLTSDRNDLTMYGPHQQEWPMMMVNGVRNVHFYNGSNPYTLAPATVTDGKDNGQQASQIMLSPFRVTENWYATEIAGSSKLIGVVLPEMGLVSYNVDGVTTPTDDEGSYTITYWQHALQMHLDPKGVWLRSYSYVIGTEAEIRQAAYALPRRTTPDFTFSKARGRDGWIIYDGGYDQKEPFTDNNWKVTFTGKADPGQPMSARGTKLVSPIGSWKASDFTTMYVRLRYTGPESQLILRYYKAGQAPDGVPTSLPQSAKEARFPNGGYSYGTQTKAFTLNNTGAWQTIPVLMTGAGWDGIIQQFELAHTDGGVIGAGETFEVQYIGATNPGN